NELMALLKNSGVIISTTFSTALHVITALILVPVFTFFFLFYRDFFEQFLQKVFPKTEGQVLTKVMEKTGSVVQGYLVGLLVVMLIVGVLNSIGFWWIGVEWILNGSAFVDSLYRNLDGSAIAYFIEPNYLEPITCFSSRSLGGSGTIY
ncbi:MAG: hypothetical protein RLZZ209_1313, partial [Bacteroidota bacterium]